MELSAKERGSGLIAQGVRNTREVVAIRLSDREREQIASAAVRQTLTLSGFVREAALQASAIVTKKATVKGPEPEPDRDERPPAVLDTDRGRPHIVDGMLVRPDGTVTDWDGA